MSALMEQHLAHRAARARLWGRPKPRPPAPPAPKDVLEAAAKHEADLAAAAELSARLEQARIAKENSGPHWSRIVSEVAKKHGFHSRDLMSTSRNKAVVRARYEAFYRMRTEILVGGAPMSFPAIGRRFGDMDHSSVLHGYRKHLASLTCEDVSSPGTKKTRIDAESPMHSMEDHPEFRKVVQ